MTAATESVRLPSELVKLARDIAHYQHRTMTSVLSQAATAWLTAYHAGFADGFAWRDASPGRKVTRAKITPS